PLQSADAGVAGAVVGEPDPTEAMSPSRAERAATGGRDVLAGWAWSTGTLQAIPDDDDFADTARAGRRRLVIAIGSALPIVAVIVVVVPAFGGPQPAADPSAQASARAPSRAAKPAVPAPEAKPTSPPAETTAAAPPPSPTAPSESPPAAA